MNEPPPTRVATGNAVLDVLKDAGIDAGSVADAIHAIYLATGTMMSREFGCGTISVEQAQERAADAVFDAAAVMAQLGERVGDLQLELVRVDPRRRRLSLCAHEGGHALGCYLLGAEVVLASVDPDDFGPDQDGITLAGGQIDFILRFAKRPPESIRAGAEAAARAATVVALLGGHAEGALFPRAFPATFGTDLSVARRVAGNFAPEGTEAKWLEDAHLAAEEIAGRARRALRALAHALDVHERLHGRQIESLLRARVGPELVGELRQLMLASR